MKLFILLIMRQNGIGLDDTNEGVLEWNTGVSTILAGTVITFSDAGTSSRFVSIGNLTSANGSFVLGASNDGILAFQSTAGISPELNPEVFLAGLDIEDGLATGRTPGSNSGLGSTVGTGLTANNILDFEDNVDGADYIGLRNGETTFLEYLDQISNIANYSTESSSGENAIPFDSTSFTITAVPEPSAFLFGGLVCGIVGLVQMGRKRRIKA